LLFSIGLGNVPGDEIKNGPQNKKSPAARRPPGGMETFDVKSTAALSDKQP
jgi:hypothetical protein